ncbi:outer membrane protein assembly factor BamE [Moraxella nasovis]|nr:outer membrane protein assembly factor BamE [Moraxella nasovis]UNU73683.1 outer membrane protein assembly factor BamE [Moraxella nasovis]
MRTFVNVKLIAAAVLSAAALTGCGIFKVYTIDLPQGTPFTKTDANRIQAGMTADQVLEILGSPAVRDTLNPYRWDYIYDYTAGTDGKRQGKKDVKNASHYISVYFNTNGQVIRVADKSQ